MQILEQKTHLFNHTFNLYKYVGNGGPFDKQSCKYIQFYPSIFLILSLLIYYPPLNVIGGLTCQSQGRLPFISA